MNGRQCARSSTSSIEAFRVAPFRPFSTTENDEKKNAVEEENGNEAATPDADDKRTVEEKLKAQIKDLKDQLLRSLAEQENTRRIAKRDVESARNFAVSSFAKSLLDTSDNLTRAVDAVDLDKLNDDETTDTKAALTTLLEGVRMTDAGLAKAFAKHGLVRFGKAGEVFDPNKHEALFEYADDKAKPGTVGQVMKVGFELNGRVVRSAEVGVVKK